jgi:hypothetical protein
VKIDSFDPYQKVQPKIGRFALHHGGKRKNLRWDGPLGIFVFKQSGVTLREFMQAQDSNPGGLCTHLAS